MSDVAVAEQAKLAAAQASAEQAIAATQAVADRAADLAQVAQDAAAQTAAFQLASQTAREQLTAIEQNKQLVSVSLQTVAAEIQEATDVTERLRGSLAAATEKMSDLEDMRETLKAAFGDLGALTRLHKVEEAIRWVKIGGAVVSGLTLLGWLAFFCESTTWQQR